MKGQLTEMALNTGLALGLAIGASAFLKMEIHLNASYEKTTDPSYAYLQAILTHTINGKPFMYYLSECLEHCEESEIIEGVNVRTELERFNESFSLLDGQRNLIIGMGKTDKNMDAVVAVPNRGRLVMYYDL